MFKIKHNDDGRDGFHITFANGWTLSVQSHEGAYCAHDGTNAEIAVWDPEGKMDYNPEWGDQVLGWQGEQEVLGWMMNTAMRGKNSRAREWEDEHAS